MAVLKMSTFHRKFEVSNVYGQGDCMAILFMNGKQFIYVSLKICLAIPLYFILSGHLKDMLIVPTLLQRYSA